MRISASIDADSNRTEAMFPQMRPIANLLSPATQTEILGILQREQDHAMALLSSSPMLASLFVLHAKQAAVLGSASTTPSPESEEWKALQNTIVTLRGEIQELNSENLELKKELELAKAFHSRVSSLEAINTAQQNDIKFLRAELAGARETYDQRMASSNAEKAALQVRILELEGRQGELKETVVEQQIKILKLECQGPTSSPNISTTPTEAASNQRQEKANRDARTKEHGECGCKVQGEHVKKLLERAAREQVEHEAREKVEREIREYAEREAREVQELTEREVKEQAEKVAREEAKQGVKERADGAVRVKAGKEVREQAERGAGKRAGQEAWGRVSREVREWHQRKARERTEKEAREQAEQEAREKAEKEEKESEKREQERLEREERENAEREARGKT